MCFCCMKTGSSSIHQVCMCFFIPVPVNSTYSILVFNNEPGIKLIYALTHYKLSNLVNFVSINTRNVNVQNIHLNALVHTCFDNALVLWTENLSFITNHIPENGWYSLYLIGNPPYIFMYHHN